MIALNIYKEPKTIAIFIILDKLICPNRPSDNKSVISSIKVGPTNVIAVVIIVLIIVIIIVVIIISVVIVFIHNKHLQKKFD